MFILGKENNVQLYIFYALVLHRNASFLHPCAISASHFYINLQLRFFSKFHKELIYLRMQGTLILIELKFQQNLIFQKITLKSSRG